MGLVEPLKNFCLLRKKIIVNIFFCNFADVLDVPVGLESRLLFLSFVNRDDVSISLLLVL